MELLSIGTFARASRLSPKALRLYDELGLLTPARVDPATGYRSYAPGQLEQARLVAWLRRLGMPLARIRHVRALPAAQAAQEVRAFWAGVEADTAARRDLAAFLVDHLTGKDPTVPAATAPLAIRYAALSDRGLVRERNQDTARAAAGLLAVADGYGGAGGPASAAAVGVFEQLDAAALPAGELLGALEDAVERAARAVDAAAAAADADGSGTTLTAMLWTGSQLALVHIGDSRVYLLRDGELFRITHDHTLVRSMVEDGRLSPDEAASHPQRSLLVRALGGGADSTADLKLQDARRGDRYLLCSDGLPSAVPTQDIHRVLATAAGPEPAVRELVGLANGRGGPDNVSCVVADVVQARE